MRVIGFAFEKISAEKNQVKIKELKVNSDIKITDVIKEKIENINQEVLKIKFRFTIDYEPKLAKIEFLGHVLASVDKTQSKEIMKKWKSHKIPEDVNIPILNFVLARCSVKALQLEDDLNIPAHIPMPRLTKKDQANDRTYVQ